jgi:hypothetical protein
MDFIAAGLGAWSGLGLGIIATVILHILKIISLITG